MHYRRTLRILATLIAFIALSGFGLKACSRPPKEATRPVELTWWRVFDDYDTVSPMIDAFRRLHPNVTINYRRLRFEEYEEELLNALAEDRGPDIVSIHNTWIGKYQAKLLPAPASITLPFTYIKGSIKKEQVTEVQKVPAPTLRGVREKYLDVVAEDVIRPEFVRQDLPPEEKIFGLPLSVDTMVLYYNRDLLNASGIPQPARFWSEFQEHIKRLTKIDNGKIIQSSAGIGGDENIPRATDILSVLMMQNGAEMTDDNGNVAFDRIPAALTDRQIPPAEEALAFYTDFANPTKEVYTWNANLPDALELFVQGRLAYFFGYSYSLSTIRARAPKLRLGIAPLPQIEQNPEINFANYWVESVARKTTHPQEAWGFLQFINEQEQVRAYLARAKRPPALRALIAESSEDPDLTTFVSQLLTAKSWYRGVNPGGAERVLLEMIESIVKGENEIHRAVQLAANRISQTLR